MEDIRLIKKYPNRRLYDTQVSQYITLEEIRQLVLAGEEFQVVDKKSGRDITQSILLQVIAEREENTDSPIFSVKSLSHIIRYHGDSIQTGFTRYLDESLELFADRYSQLNDRLRALIGQNPLHSLGDLVEENIPLWKRIRREYLSNLGRSKADEDAAEAGEPKAAEKDHEKTQP